MSQNDSRVGTFTVAPFTATYAIPLPNGKEVTLSGHFPLSREEFFAFMRVLEAFTPGLVEPGPDPLRESLERLGYVAPKEPRDG